MPNFREFNSKLESMSGMRRVTSTMKMVSASHLHRMQRSLTKSQPFAQALIDLLPVIQQKRFANHKLLQDPPKDGSSKVLIVIFTGDRGLCGAFNNALIRQIKEWQADHAQDFASIEALYVGQKALTALNELIPSHHDLIPMPNSPVGKDADAIAQIALDGFYKGDYDEIWLASSHYINSMTNDPQIARLLPNGRPPMPVKIENAQNKSPAHPEKPLLVPDDAFMLETIASLWVQLGFYFALQSSVTAEHAARVMAMDNATNNLSRMTQDLTIQRNRARQSQITNELTEIVSGAEAIK